MPLVPQVTLQDLINGKLTLLDRSIHQQRDQELDTSLLQNYLTRWVEVELVRDCSTEITTRFLLENVVTRFGCPRILMSDQGTHFLNRMIAPLTEDF
jgi:hypothetical protein